MDIVNNSGKLLFVLYLMISSNYLGNLFGCRIQNELNRNMLLKHILGFLTLYFFVSIVDPAKYSPQFKLAVSAAIYFAFMMSTKMNVKSFYILISLIGSVYVLYIIKDTFNEKWHKYIDYLQFVLMIAAIITLIVGFIYYMGEKKMEYKDEYAFSKFLVGAPSCKLETPEFNKSFIETMKIGIVPEKYTE